MGGTIDNPDVLDKEAATLSLEAYLMLHEVTKQSESNYGKLFKYRTGQSPMACFIQLKIRKACELLDQTNQSVLSISKQLGYDDPYYFSRLFKKTQGCSPTHYRTSTKS